MERKKKQKQNSLPNCLILLVVARFSLAVGGWAALAGGHMEKRQGGKRNARLAFVIREKQNIMD